MILKGKAQFLIILGLAVVFKDGHCSSSTPEVFVAEGSVAVLPCADDTSGNSHPTAVYWSRMNGSIQKTIWRREKSGIEFRPVRYPSHAYCPVPNFGKGNYSLHIAGVTVEDAGKYICEVEGKTRVTRVIQVVMLRVIKVSFSPAVVVEGSRVEKTCHITPGSQSVRPSWKRNGKSTGSTALQSVTQKDAGNWTCQVLYKGTTVGEATVSLQVKGIITPQDDSTAVYAAVGSSVSLPCVFTEGLIPNTVTWGKVSTKVYSPFPLPSSFNQSLRLPLHPWDRSAWIERVEDGDAGIYTCSGMIEGSNGRRMKVQRRMELVVSQVLSSPVSSGKGPVTLTCHLSNSSEVTSYEWLRVSYGMNNTQTQTSVKNSKELKIQKVTEKDAGEWVCRYSGNQGVLGNITYELHIMGGLKGDGEPASGNKAAMVFGLGFLFLAIFVILFQMYRNYRRKKMTLLYPAMETIVHQAANERERRERCKPKVNEACGGV